MFCLWRILLITVKLQEVGAATFFVTRSWLVLYALR